MAGKEVRNQYWCEAKSSTRSDITLMPRRWRYLGCGGEPIGTLSSNFAWCTHLMTVGGRGRSWRIWPSKTAGQRKVMSRWGGKNPKNAFLWPLRRSIPGVHVVSDVHITSSARKGKYYLQGDGAHALPDTITWYPTLKVAFSEDPIYKWLVSNDMENTADR